MTAGFELLIEPAAKGLASLITDTTKTGSSSALGKGVQALSSKYKQAIFQASRKYIETYQKRHCQLRVLGMREPIDLSAVYTGVRLLDSKGVLQYEIEALEDSFRQTRLRGYSSQHSGDEKHSGIAIANQKQYLMVLGGPGADKSTFLRKVGLEALRTFYYERAEYSHRLIPVLIELKRFEANDIDIAKFIADEFETCGFPEAEAFTQNALSQGNLLILLDGLDEVPSANLNKVLQTIRDFGDRYDDNRFIASCRVAASGYRADAFRRFSNVTMADFDDKQIQQFIRNWFGSAQDLERNKAEKCWESLQKPENKASKELAHTPLLLTHLCLVYDRAQRFPNNRSSLYKKALRILLEEWAAEKSILRDDIYEGLSIEQEEILLSEIAYNGMTADQLFFTKRELSAQIKVFLSTNLNAPKYLDSEAVLNAIEVQQGILVKRTEDTYSFSHLTFQEYLTAQYLVDNNEWELLVQRHLTNSRWREVFLLLPGLTTGRVGADKFLLALEKQANKYLYSSKLQQLIQWSEFSTNGSAENIKPAAKKVFAIFLACSLAVDLNRSLALVFGQSLGFDYMPPELSSAISLAHSLSLDFNFYPARYLDHCIYHEFDFDFSLTHSIELERAAYFSRSEILSHCDFNELIKKIERIKPNIDDINFKGAQFLGNLYGLWFSTLCIETETATLSK
ncbi:MAG: NACHT domain-containing protein, partial [Phormidesmis sp.]